VTRLVREGGTLRVQQREVVLDEEACDCDALAAALPEGSPTELPFARTLACDARSAPEGDSCTEPEAHETQSRFDADEGRWPPLEL